MNNYRYGEKIKRKNRCNEMQNKQSEVTKQYNTGLGRGYGNRRIQDPVDDFE